MEWFLITVILWGSVLFFLRPKPSDLRAEMPSRWKSFKEIRLTFWLGVVFCAAFFIFLDGNFGYINNDWLAILGINNVEKFTPWWLAQTFTHNFIHLDFWHLLMNLSLLGLLSLYERKVEAKRFLAVFLFSGVLSSVSVLFISEPVVAAGASAGLLGLSAAYFLDNPKLTLKECVLGVCFVFFVYWALRLQANQKMAELYHVDEWGHMFGLILGVLYCKLFPKKETIIKNVNKSSQDV